MKYARLRLVLFKFLVTKQGSFSTGLSVTKFKQNRKVVAAYYSLLNRNTRAYYQEILMDNRARKRRLTLQRRKNGRLPIRFILTAEDRPWLDITPVGREFGSIEFEKYGQYVHEVMSAFE